MRNLKGNVTTIGTLVMAVVVLAPLTGGCGGSAGILSPAFINSLSGGYYPLTPGPNAPFILIRVVNETGQNAEFIVTVERLVVETDENGNFLFDENDAPVTRTERETKRLATSAEAPGNDIGVLFECGQFPLTRIGLGENLLPTDAAVFIGGAGVAGSAGFGVRAGDLNPLELLSEDGISNFNCGDTVIFRAFESIGVAGGVALQAFLLPGSEQPSEFLGPSTFESLAEVLESQAREEEP